MAIAAFSGAGHRLPPQDMQGANPQGRSLRRAEAPAGSRQGSPVHTNGEEKARPTKTKGDLHKTQGGEGAWEEGQAGGGWTAGARCLQL